MRNATRTILVRLDQNSPWDQAVIELTQRGLGTAAVCNQLGLTPSQVMSRRRKFCHGFLKAYRDGWSAESQEILNDVDHKLKASDTLAKHVSNLLKMRRTRS